MQDISEYAVRTTRAPFDPRCETITFLYRYFGADRRLLYSGITNDLVRRHGDHSRARWRPLAVVMCSEAFPNREIALIAEDTAIFEEQPDYNLQCVYSEKIWRRAHHWYRDRTNGEFVGEERTWFTCVYGQAAEKCAAPGWVTFPILQQRATITDHSSDKYLSTACRGNCPTPAPRWPADLRGAV